MNEECNRLAQESATLLLELAQHANIKWDGLYAMFQRKEGSYGGTQVFRSGRQIMFIETMRDKVATEISRKILATLDALFERLRVSTGKSPTACVLTVDKFLDFKIKFAHDSTQGMSVRLMDLGRPESFFEPAEVDIPEHIRKAQKAMDR